LTVVDNFFVPVEAQSALLSREPKVERQINYKNYNAVLCFQSFNPVFWYYYPFSSGQHTSEWSKGIFWLQGQPASK
jgi:hypothetical protein